MSYKNVSCPRDHTRFTLVLRARRRFPDSDRIYEFDYGDDQSIPIAVNNSVSLPVVRTAICPGALPFDILDHDHYPDAKVSQVVYPVRFTVVEYEWVPIEILKVNADEYPVLSRVSRAKRTKTSALKRRARSGRSIMEPT